MLGLKAKRIRYLAKCTLKKKSYSKDISESLERRAKKLKIPIQFIARTLLVLVPFNSLHCYPVKYFLLHSLEEYMTLLHLVV